MSAPTTKQYTYLPAPHERAYYGVLFQAADDERAGSIGGAKAVTFFTRSKLPITILKDIWTFADQPPTNALDPMKFAVAIRLIQCEQNGIAIASISSPDLTQGLPPNLRPAYFDGIPLPPAPPAAGVGGAPPPQHLQQQPPPPQQQQVPPRPPVMGGGSVAPPPPPMVQHQRQPSHDNVSVVGPGSVTAPPPMMHHNQQQLTVQDPYMLTPTEQSRYEILFPDYVHQDPTGTYMSGSEAVALFGKSGLSQPILAQIWNMVDTNPVDNQLDKIEFVIAMHLIVCISKKNLPVPPSLPLSLKNLKAQHSQHPPAQVHDDTTGPGVPQTISYQPPPPSTPDRMSQQQHPPPTMMTMQQSPQPPVMMTMQQSPQPPTPTPSMRQMAPPPLAATTTSSLSGLAGPPPLAPSGGLSISDAFEGLDGNNDTTNYMMSQPTTGFANMNSNTMGSGGDTGSIASYHMTTPDITTTHKTMQSKLHETNHDPLDQIPEPPVVVTTQNNSNNDNNKNYVSSYNMGDSNMELQKLKDALQKLQAENISLKATMGTLSHDEQDVQKELNATISEVTKLSNELTKTRAQVLASKSRLLEATAELKAAKEKKGVLKDLITDATVTKQAIDDAHESIENANIVLARTYNVAPAPAPLPAVAEEDLFGGWGNEDSGAVNAPLPALGSGNFSSTGGSADESQPTSLYGNTYSSPPPMETPQQQEQLPDMSMNPASYSYNAQPDLSLQHQPPPQTNMYNGGGYTGGMGHNRDLSGNDFGEVMGSNASSTMPLSSQLPTINQYDSGFGSNMSSMGAQTYDSIPHVTSMKELEDLKAKSKEADDVAKEAEASRRQAVAQLEELRKLADEAESKVRMANEKPTKKKGILGRGGAAQKKDAKEVEKLVLDARDKKDALLQAQAQVKDAEALAVATKREAERLLKEAEDAQMSAAAAASMQEQNQQHQMTVSSTQSPRYDIPGSTGGGGMMSMYNHNATTTGGMDYANPFG